MDNTCRPLIPPLQTTYALGMGRLGGDSKIRDPMFVGSTELGWWLRAQPWSGRHSVVPDELPVHLVGLTVDVAEPQAADKCR